MADQGLAIDPNYASLYTARGYSKINLGQFDEATSDIHKAMQLVRATHKWASWRANLADAEMGLGNCTTRQSISCSGPSILASAQAILIGNLRLLMRLQARRRKQRLPWPRR
ncbi:MAG: hypothetical protein R3C69_06010 [Geminicoccaceae bacterium]